jgi:hypothetical protein
VLPEKQRVEIKNQVQHTLKQEAHLHIVVLVQVKKKE